MNEGGRVSHGMRGADEACAGCFGRESNRMRYYNDCEPRYAVNEDGLSLRLMVDGAHGWLVVSVMGMVMVCR